MKYRATEVGYCSFTQAEGQPFEFYARRGTEDWTGTYDDGMRK